TGKRRQVFAMVGAVALLGALTACTSPAPPPDPSPSSPEPTPTVSAPSPTPTTPEPPEKPEAMQRTDEAGALAAAEYFMAVYSHARRTGDLSGWIAFSGQTCEFCSAVGRGVAAIYDSGGQLVGGETDVSDVRLLSTDTELVLYIVQLRYETESATRLDAAGVVTARYQAEDSWLLLNVAPSSGGWMLLGGEQIDEPQS
ncbi:MAG TPA: DUF6318 family protein, partial [Actinotalea sp.]|nr:DUF6318 family protein [Actinotalea sp.]